MLSGRAEGSCGGRRPELEHPPWENVVPGLSRTPDSPAGAGTAGVGVPAGLSQLCSTFLAPRTVLSGASLSGPVPFKPLELLPAVA